MRRPLFSFVPALTLLFSHALFVSGQTTELTIPNGTPVEVESTFNVSSGDVEKGDAISFTVVQPVKINGVIVIAAGARATARVTKAKKGASWGRPGQLAWAMQDVVAVDGTRVPLEFSRKKRGVSRTGTVAAGMIMTGLLFWPATPYWSLKKGEDAILPVGSRFAATVQRNTTINLIVPDKDGAPEENPDHESDV